AIVVGVGTLVGSRGNPLLSAAAAAVVAIAFSPVRHWAQGVANRLVYGRRASPYQVLSEFATRLSQSPSLDDVVTRLARLVADGTGAERASVWLHEDGTFREVAATDGSSGRTLGELAEARPRFPDREDAVTAVHH